MTLTLNPETNRYEENALPDGERGSCALSRPIFPPHNARSGAWRESPRVPKA